MQPFVPRRPSFWQRMALWLTTVPARAGRAPDLRLAAGWRLRLAAPQWEVVWRGCPEAQQRLRAVVCPMPWNGWEDPFWRALVAQRLFALGLSEEAPEPWFLEQAEQQALARIAPPWTAIMAGRPR